MIRTILAIATAFLAVMTVFASAAEACISCDHIPVVVRGSLTPGVVTRYAYKSWYYRPYRYRPYRYRRRYWRRRYR